MIQTSTVGGSVTDTPARAILTLLALTIVAGALLWRGYDYYRQGLTTRAEHATIGCSIPPGCSGTDTASLERRSSPPICFISCAERLTHMLPPWIGSMKSWLNAHVFTGLVGLF